MAVSACAVSASAQQAAPTFSNDIVAGIAWTHVRVGFNDEPMRSRNGVMVNAGGRMCVTCRADIPFDVGATLLLASITATDVKGVTLQRQPYGFAQEGLLGVQVIGAFRALPQVRPYVIIWPLGQTTAERVDRAAGVDRILNYHDGLPRLGTWGIEFRPNGAGGALDVRVSGVHGAFQEAELLKQKSSVSPPLRYSGWMANLGYFGPFYGLWP